MVSDGQVKELRRMLAQGKSLAASSRMAEMSEKTARDYRDDDRLPSDRKQPRTYRTRTDPFADVWPEIQQRLEQEPRLKAYTLFGWLQASRPGEFADSTRRTFERRVSQWQGLHGPGKPVFFSQEHHPGELAASDFTVCNELSVTIAGRKFEHSFYHCVLTYSNIESVSLCFSESFEALSEGIQKSFWEFGGVPLRHRTDSLSAAVKNHSSRKSHTDRYTALMDHYQCQPQRTNARCANENGDVESSNRHFKARIDQALLLRGSRDFASREEYVALVEGLVATANSNRRQRLSEEQAALQRLPDQRLDTADLLLGIRVGKGSTIRVRTNIYSVPSRLIGKQVDVRIEAEHIEVTYQGHSIQTMPRLFGKQGVSINYRHVIDSLVRKPGAFAQYKYQHEMFPTSQFRMAYDMLSRAHASKVADKQYVKILELAAKESQDAVDHALRVLIGAGVAVDFQVIEVMVQDAADLPLATQVNIEAPDLSEFDCLYSTFDKESLSDEQVKNPIPETGCQNHGGLESDVQQTAIDSITETGSEPNRTQSRSGADRAVSGATDAELSGSLRGGRNASVDRGLEPFGLLVGADDVGMRITAGGADQAHVDSFEVTAGQDVGVLRLQPLTASHDSADGNTQGRFVLGAARERVAVRQARFGQESCLVCVGPAADLAGTQSLVHDLRDAGSTAANCQAGLAVAETVQETIELRGLDHRRLGLCPAEPRGDGSLVHAAGRTIRARQCDVDQQLGVQQVGSDLQGHDDHRGRNRSAGSPQRDHRDERPKLPNRNRKEGQSKNLFPRLKNEKLDYFNRSSNCR